MTEPSTEDQVFRALADPRRRAIFEALSEHGEQPVLQLVERFDISQPAVSQHLRTLREAGLVRARREGRLTYYEVDPEGLAPLVDWIAHYRAFWTERLHALATLLEEMDR